MTHTYDEIRSQAATWRLTLETAAEQWTLASESIRLQPDTQFLLVGSGSSLHIARSAARSLQETTTHVARAVASSEVFLSSASTVSTGVPVIAFVISRSGETSEAVIAADFLVENFPNVTVVGVTCNRDTELERRTHHSISLPHAAERSVVMTRSFTSMLLALQVIAASVAPDKALLDQLSRLPDLLDRNIDRFEKFSLSIGPNLAQDQFIYLGLGQNEGLAQEATLKLKEMTQTISEAYSPLEFRHGPISIVRPGTTVVILEAVREQAYMADLEADLKRHGAFVGSIAPYDTSGADARLELPAGLSDIARCLLYLPPLQLIAYHRALAADLDPDQPRNLSHVVVLADVAPPAPPRRKLGRG
jgi:glutamine---fructose-6-phosphate transaminase (isomerizing)